MVVFTFLRTSFAYSFCDSCTVITFACKMHHCYQNKLTSANKHRYNRNRYIVSNSAQRQSALKCSSATWHHLIISWQYNMRPPEPNLTILTSHCRRNFCLGHELQQNLQILKTSKPKNGIPYFSTLLIPNKLILQLNSHLQLQANKDTSDKSKKWGGGKLLHISCFRSASCTAVKLFGLYKSHIQHKRDFGKLLPWLLNF